MSKRLLVAVSHAIERFALASGDDQPTLVIAMFQRLSYFEREVEMYRRIAGQNPVTVVGLAEDFPPSLPPGIDHVLFDESDPLAREWSVVVLSPRSGACLVATDTETVLDDAVTLEAGRGFDGYWSFRREDAYREVLRLRAALSVHAPAATIGRIDQVLREVVASPYDDGGDPRMEGALRFVTEQMDRALRRAGRSQRVLDDVRDDDRDRTTGVRTPQFLQRWTAGGASGTLPVGLIGLQVVGIEGMRASLGMRAEHAALASVGEALQTALDQRVDRAVRLGPSTFLLVLPASEPAELAHYHQQIQQHLHRSEQSYPYVPLQTAAAATVTRDRPLPVDEVVSAAMHSPPARLSLLS